MKVEEKRKIREAITLLMSDEGFNDGIDILCGLVGLERAVTKAMKDPSASTVNVLDLLAGGEAVEHPLAQDEGYSADLPGDSTPEDLSGLGSGSTPALRQ